MKGIGGRHRQLHETRIAPAQFAGQVAAGFVAHDVGDHWRAVIVALNANRTVRMQALRRPTASASVHRFVEEADYLALFGGGGHPMFGLLGTSHHPRDERAERDTGHQIDSLGLALQAIEELRKRHPIPRQTGLHRGIRDALQASHREHRPLALLRPHRGKAEAAVADHDRGHAVPSRNRAVGIPKNLRVIVRVQVDESGSDNQAGSVESRSRRRRRRGCRSRQSCHP